MNENIESSDSNSEFSDIEDVKDSEIENVRDCQYRA
jgi:hypothetical protein